VDADCIPGLVCAGSACALSRARVQCGRLPNCNVYRSNGEAYTYRQCHFVPDQAIGILNRDCPLKRESRQKQEERERRGETEPAPDALECYHEVTCSCCEGGTGFLHHNLYREP
jgi:hypothetical protein